MLSASFAVYNVADVIVVFVVLGKIGKAKDGKLAGKSYTVHKQAGQFFK